MVPLAFFIDVDNTLLDNDHIKKEIKRSLDKILGTDEANHFWQHHDQFRTEQQLVDFPRIIRQYCHEKHEDTCEMTFSQIFSTIEFKHALFPQTPAVLQHLKTLGHVSLFTEGDSVYQKMKIEKSGLAALVDEVFLYDHKLEHLGDIVNKFESYQNVFIDDRASFLVTIKNQFPTIFTIEVAQGHYSTIDHTTHQKLDRKIKNIAVLLKFTSEDFR